MQDIHAIIPVALIDVMEHLLPTFEAHTGVRVTATHVLNPEVPALIDGGARFDLAFSNPIYLRQVITAGHADRATHRAFGRAPLAFAALGPAPNVPAREADSIAAVLRGAPRIAFTGAGTSGAMMHAMAARLGLEAALSCALRPMEGGEPMRALLAGEVDLAALPLTNIAPIGAVHSAAICPLDWDVHIDLSLIHTSKVGKRLADWLTAPERTERLSALGALPYTL